MTLEWTTIVLVGTGWLATSILAGIVVGGMLRRMGEEDAAHAARMEWTLHPADRAMDDPHPA